MKRVREMRSRKVAEIAELERKLQEAKVELRVLDGILGDEADGAGGGRRRNTKKTVLEIVTEADTDGVTPGEVVEKAATGWGKTLKLSSVQSLLSKEKAAGTLVFNGERYYVAGKAPSPDVPPLRAVK